jgi:hypothetical protein
MRNGLPLFLLTIFFAMLAREGVYAAGVEDETKAQDARTSSSPKDHERAAKTNRPHSSSGLTKPSHLPLPRNQKHSASGKAVAAPKTGAGRAASSGNGVPAINNGPSKTRPVQPQITSRPFTPASTNVRHRNPNPATVGGSTVSKTPNTVAINGTHVGRKR